MIILLYLSKFMDIWIYLPTNTIINTYMEFIQWMLKIIKLMKNWVDNIGTFVFSNFGARHVASQRFFPRKSTFVCFFGPYCHFSWFFWGKKDAQRNLASNDVYESPWSPVIDHLVQFWIMSVQNNPRLSWSLGLNAWMTSYSIVYQIRYN